MNKYLKSILSLAIVCLSVALLLGATYLITNPIIQKMEDQKVQEALKVVMPDGVDFQKIDIAGKGLPSTITEAYSEKNGGYVFRMVTSGYQSGMVLLCGVDKDGVVTGATCISSSETLGYEKTYGDSLVGKDASTIGGVDTVAGATKTTEAYKNAVRDALSAKNTLEGNAPTMDAVDLSRLPEGLIDTTIVKEALVSPTDGHYEFLLEAKGVQMANPQWYPDQTPITIRLSIDRNGVILSCVTVNQAESEGYGDVSGTPEFYNQFTGKNESNYTDIVISGSTITTNGYHDAIRQAYTVLDYLSSVKDALSRVMPNADSLTIVNIQDANLPAGITQVYRVGNGGYIFRITTNGFMPNMDILCGVDKDGVVTGAVCLSSEETLGQEKTYGEALVGATASTIDGIDTVAGATKTTEAYKNAVKDVLNANAVLNGEEPPVVDPPVVDPPVVLPDDITPIDLATIPADLFDNTIVKALYVTKAGNYLFVLEGKGVQMANPQWYPDQTPITIHLTLAKNGTILSCITVNQAESGGYGDVCGTPDFYDRFTGKDASDYTDVIISGSTITTNGYHEAIAEAYKILAHMNAKTPIDLSQLPTDLFDNTIVKEVYLTGNGYYEFLLTAKGVQMANPQWYPDQTPITIRLVLDENGNIISCVTLSQAESSGYGDVCGQPSFYGQFTGKNESNYSDVIISGSTITTNGYHAAIAEAYKILGHLVKVKIDLSSIPSELFNATILKEVYLKADGSYLFVLEGQGVQMANPQWYPDQTPITIHLTLAKDGTILSCVTVNQAESNGYGDVCGTPDFYNQFIGKDNTNYTDIIISGSTITTNGYHAAIAEAYKVLAYLNKTEVDLNTLPAGTFDDSVVKNVHTFGDGYYEFLLTAKGVQMANPQWYPDQTPITIRLILDKDGKIVSCVTLSQAESSGYGDVCGTPEFYNQFIGKDNTNYTDIIISGSTITTNGYHQAIGEAYKILSHLTTNS